MFIVTTVTMIVLFLWLGQYDKVAINRWDLCSSVQKNTLVFKRQIWSFTSLQNQTWKHKFSSLPLPSETNNSFSFICHKDFWIAEISRFDRNTEYIFYTFSTEDYIGSIQFKNKPKRFFNNMEIEWNNVYWKERENLYYLGNSYTGTTLNIHKTNIATQNNIYLNWVKAQLPKETLFSFTNKEPGTFVIRHIEHDME